MTKTLFILLFLSFCSKIIYYNTETLPKPCHEHIFYILNMGGLNANPDKYILNHLIIEKSRQKPLLSDVQIFSPKDKHSVIIASYYKSFEMLLNLTTA